MLRTRFLGVVTGVLSWSSCLYAQPDAKDALSLSKRIDAVILKRAQDDGIAVVGPTDDASFIRRLSLDLIGKIPTLTDSRDYVENDDADKRWDWVERYLKDQRYSQHFAVIFRNILLPTSDPFGRDFQSGFELYLKDRLERNSPYNTLAKEILTSPLSGNLNGGNMQATNSAAFFAVNAGKPEDMASATSRVFLGVKLDCAQCHAHPFASWSKEQFWEFAAFFNSNTPGVPRPAAKGTPLKAFEIAIPGTQKTVKAKFLDGLQPKAEGEPLTALADWVTSAQNPYFARAAADHLWTYFFGVSLHEPIVEQANDDAITHPELLDLLAKELIDHQFDLKYLIRAIVHSQAYQRSSEGQGSLQDLKYFARMPVRGLTAEQFFDSFCEATGYRESPGLRNMARRAFGEDASSSPRQQFLAKFGTGERRHETHATIQQALFLMNGKFAREQTRVESNESLRTIVESKRETTARKLQTLFLMTVSRLPRSEERDRFESYIDNGIARGEAAQAWSDVFWALLNSAEFRLNH